MRSVCRQNRKEFNLPIIDHLSVGVPDIACAREFYDPLLEAVGSRYLAAGADFSTYGAERVEFLPLLPFDGNAPSGGNGTHIGFAASSRDAMDAFYQAGLRAGGTDEGAPGVRADYPMDNIYAAYIRDPFGNRLEAVYNGFSSKRN